MSFDPAISIEGSDQFPRPSALQRSRRETLGNAIPFLRTQLEVAQMTLPDMRQQVATTAGRLLSRAAELPQPVLDMVGGYVGGIGDTLDSYAAAFEHPRQVVRAVHVLREAQIWMDLQRVVSSDSDLDAVIARGLFDDELAHVHYTHANGLSASVPNLHPELPLPE